MSGKNGKNDTEDNPIIISYKSMPGRHSNSTISRAIKELQGAGFIKRISHGGLEGSPNSYILTDDWRRVAKK